MVRATYSDYSALLCCVPSTLRNKLIRRNVIKLSHGVESVVTFFVSGTTHYYANSSLHSYVCNQVISFGPVTTFVSVTITIILD